MAFRLASTPYFLIWFTLIHNIKLQSRSRIEKGDNLLIFGDAIHCIQRKLGNKKLRTAKNRVDREWTEEEEVGTK
jgi:hypothetical protein